MHGNGLCMRQQFAHLDQEPKSRRICANIRDRFVDALTNFTVSAGLKHNAGAHNMVALPTCQ